MNNHMEPKMHCDLLNWIVLDVCKLATVAYSKTMIKATVCAYANFVQFWCCPPSVLLQIKPWTNKYQIPLYSL